MADCASRKKFRSVITSKSHARIVHGVSVVVEAEIVVFAVHFICERWLPDSNNDYRFHWIWDPSTPAQDEFTADPRCMQDVEFVFTHSSAISLAILLTIRAGSSPVHSSSIWLARLYSTATLFKSVRRLLLSMDSQCQNRQRQNGRDCRTIDLPTQVCHLSPICCEIGKDPKQS